MPGLHVLQYGSDDGQPLVVLHGFPGSGTQGLLFRDHAPEFNLKVFSPDRPGYGKSRPQRRRGFQHWAEMLRDFLEREKLNQVDLIGISGGAPFAIAAASHLPEQTRRLGIVCGLAPFPGSEAFSIFQARGLSFYRRAPRPLTTWMVERFIDRIEPERRLQVLARILNEKDAAVLKSDQVRPTLLRSIFEAREQGAKGVLNDLDHYCRDWKIDWSKIKAPTWIWHGDDDRLLNPKMAEEIHAKIPHARLRLFAGEGHYSLPVLRAGEILADFYSST